MKYSIKVQKLKKHFKVHQKEAGLSASLANLFKREYKTVKAVDNISFEIEQGELIGFIGPNGAGKTTTLKTLSGLLYPTSGNCEVLSYTPHCRQTKFLKQISLVMGQKNQLWWDLPAMETFNLNKEIYNIPDKQYHQILDELIEMLEIQDIIKQQVRRLSLGQRMKCELVAALIHQPQILFLDEPTIGLDVVMQKRVREFIKNYNKKYNATVILTSHYMDDVKEICQRIIMINHGKIVFDGKIYDLIKKYANYKILVPVFNKKVKKSELEPFGKVLEYTPYRAVINIPRDKISDKASQLLKKFDIDDLDINEPELEDIVRQIFEK